MTNTNLCCHLVMLLRTSLLCRNRPGMIDELLWKFVHYRRAEHNRRDRRMVVNMRADGRTVLKYAGGGIPPAMRSLLLIAGQEQFRHVIFNTPAFLYSLSSIEAASRWQS
ncbi:hypothetical protein K461DRAFT_264987 [Myriangium duriaei CBS 260.36]|uniref:Uncharacterized protein n=1 Tax=Myriangium duriaei CBS 260.36 TaxID=1168546 RepID=A0A9P4JB31_9PEZI|nr:hypothetical protein K461DRAFT_264987 [Myriangium duriaei CBS 260.36]